MSKSKKHQLLMAIKDVNNPNDEGCLNVSMSRNEVLHFFPHN